MKAVFRIIKQVLSASMLMALLVSPVVASAATNNNGSSATQAVTKTYNAEANVQVGMMVSLKQGDSNTVIPLKSGNNYNFLGVVVPASSAPIILSSNSVNQQQALVISGGKTTVLVSSQNGPIKNGDDLTVSSLDGVAMKAAITDPQIIGKAITEFNGSKNVISQVSLKDSSGKQKTVSIGRVGIDITLSSNPKYQQQTDYVPGFLMSIAKSTAGKSVSVARIYISLAILVATVIIVGNILYAGVKTGMLAVGRNPLSKRSIIRSLIQTAIVAIIIFLIGLFAVYLLLKL
jgi:hypothetical protein